MNYTWYSPNSNYCEFKLYSLQFRHLMKTVGSLYQLSSLTGRQVAGWSKDHSWRHKSQWDLYYVPDIQNM